MKKRAIVALGVVAAILLTGCADTSVKNDIIVVSDVKMEESTEENVVEIEEAVQTIPMAESMEISKTETVAIETKYIHTAELIDSEVYKSLSVIQEPDVNHQYFEVEKKSGEKVRLKEPAGLEVWSVATPIVADFDGDGADEIAFMCGQTAYYQGVYMIDVDEERFLEFPYEVGSYVPRPDYEVYAEDATHIRVKAVDGTFEEVALLSSVEVFEMNHVGDGPIEEQKRLEQKLFAEKGTLIAGSSEVSYISRTSYQGKDCLLLLQPLALGRNTCFGWIETILSWDETGVYHVEMSNYMKDKDTYYNNPENVVYDSKQSGIHHLYNDEYEDLQLVLSIQYERNDDYRLHIYTKPEDGNLYGELLYTFPDIREGNQGIGKIQDLYFVDQADLNDDGKLDVFSVARYMTEEGLCYDTRVYLCNGMEYVPDYEYMDELNSTYHLTAEDANDYPIMTILSGATVQEDELYLIREE